MDDERLRTITPQDYNAAQADAAAHFLASRGTPVFGPFEPLIHSPELMTRASDMGLYLRYGSAIGQVLSEFVILLTARAWSQDYEWALHSRIAADVGISAAIIAALADGRRPEAMDPEQVILYDFVTELLQTRRVSDATYAAAIARFSEQGVVDVIGLTGYYSLLAMTLNVARTKVPEGGATLPRFP